MNKIAWNLAVTFIGGVALYLATEWLKVPLWPVIGVGYVIGIIQGSILL